MTALKMILCGEVPKSVEHQEEEFKTDEDLRSVTMKWAVNQKIPNERTRRDPMDFSNVPWNSAPTSDWGTQENWKTAVDAAWGPNNNASPTDVRRHSKGKGKR